MVGRQRQRLPKRNPKAAMMAKLKSTQAENELPERERVETLPPPFQVIVQFGQPWNVVTPSIYRYEDTQWIDQFFADGRLRLSTFAKFSTYPDEVRGDPNEGFNIAYGETGNNQSMMLVMRQGVSAVVLCCSRKLDHDLRKRFQRDSAFEILNTVGFSHEISRQLAGFRFGMEGSCKYKTNTGIKRSIALELEKYVLPDGSMDMRMVQDASLALGGTEVLLTKQKKYQDQQEYRLIWELDVVDTEFVDIVAPNARQFCRRVSIQEYDF